MNLPEVWAFSQNFYKKNIKNESSKSLGSPATSVKKNIK